MNRSLLKIGQDLAENPSWWKKIRHSKFADPFRRKSLRKIGTKAISFTASVIIPIPVVRGLIVGAIKKGIGKARAAQVKYKMGVEQSMFTYKGKDYATLKGKERDTAEDKLKHDVKWGWKSLSVENMDRYRWKVKHGVEMLNEAFTNAEKHQIITASICNDFARAIAKYYYLEKRCKILREKSEVIKALATATIEWVDKVQKDIADKKIKDKLIDHAAEISAHSDNYKHDKCDKTLCVLKDTQRFWSKHKNITKGAQIITSFTVSNVADPTESKFPYTKSYWES